MRIVNAALIKNTVKALCVKANIELRKDVLDSLKLARKKETFLKAKNILGIIIANAAIARKKKLPICQDTGMVIVYLKIGQGICIKGDLKRAVQEGVKAAYKEAYFRKSIVKDPLIRKNTNNNLPAVIYTDIVPGNKIEINIVPKGFGCENTGKTRMFRPTDDIDLIEDFIVDTVREAGSRPCPPIYIGVGIGGTLDKAVSLSREAIFRPVNKNNKLPHVRKLENDILRRVNSLKIGPIGVGGHATALGVSVLTFPTHIAGLPVAVNISCHATRSAKAVIF